jgi:hypothetical protein
LRNPLPAPNVFQLVFDSALELHLVQPVINPNINTISTSRNPIRHTNTVNLNHGKTPSKTNEEQRRRLSAQPDGLTLNGATDKTCRMTAFNDFDCQFN